jgi:hypothetical protein
LQPHSLPNRFQVIAQDAEMSRNLCEAFQEAVSTGELIKDEEETLLVRDSQDSWWKLYRVPLRRRLFAFAAQSRARREWRALEALAHHKIPAVSALAVGEERLGPFLLSSLLVTQGIPKGLDLRALLRNIQNEERETLLKKAGQAIRQFHDAGFIHFRMQTRNLISATPENLESPNLLWLDTPYSCYFQKGAPTWLKIVDLVDFAGTESILSLEDARTLLLAYSRKENPLTSAEALHSRTRRQQKLRRIAGYLYAINTGNRP